MGAKKKRHRKFGGALSDVMVAGSLQQNNPLLGSVSTTGVICALPAVSPQVGDAPKAIEYPADRRRSHKCGPSAQ